MKQFNGVYPAIVTDNVDPENSGRVKVRIPGAGAAGGKGQDIWARVATLMAGRNRGTWFIPDVDDEVLVAFEAGDPRQPYVLGSLWNGQDSPPQAMSSGNDIKLLRSRNGVKITLNDKSGSESFMVETPGGQRLILRDGPGSIEIRDGNGNSVRLGPEGVTLECSARVLIHASDVRVSASMINVDAGIAKFSGTVQCNTLITNSVISASYTPGAGNIM